MRVQTIVTNTGGKYATCYINQHVLRLSSIEFFKYMYMCVCTYVQTYECRYPWDPEEWVRPELEFQEVVSHLR